MKEYLVLAICLLSFTVHANQRAVTDEGDIVILNSDGTWEYESPNSNPTAEIPFNTETFKKGKNSTFTLKSKVNNSKFSFDPKIWSFKKGDGSNQHEYVFQLKDGDLYGTAITEGIEIELASFPQLALQNAKDAAPDARITKQEYRNVNGNKVMYVEIDGTMQGIKFKYLGYYFSNSTGSTQFLTYTGTSLVNRYRSDIENFLNGFELQ